eukprot:135817_1
MKPFLTAPLLDIQQSKDCLSNSFLWLNTFVLYCPMWTKKLPFSKQSRSCGLSFIVLFVTISSILYHLIYILIRHWVSFDYVDSLIYQIIYGILEILHTISSFLSLYYFYRYFNF